MAHNQQVDKYDFNYRKDQGFDPYADDIWSKEPISSTKQIPIPQDMKEYYENGGKEDTE